MRRHLTPGERKIAASVFGDEIDYDPVTINRRKWYPLHPERFIMAPDGHIWIHPKSGHWSEDFSAAEFKLQALFIHEMTHVWQAQTKGKYYLPLMRHPFCRYDYRYTAGMPFHWYGLEQQAEIVRHVFVWRQGWHPGPLVAPLTDLEPLLPFLGTVRG